jgi:hypothetical protein
MEISALQAVEGRAPAMYVIYIKYFLSWLGNMIPVT